jgi:signal transduction histidine kinase
MGFGRFLFGLRARLMALVLLVCLPLAALTLHQTSQERRREFQKWENTATRLSEAAAAEEDKLLRDTRQLLLSLSTYSSARSGRWDDVRTLLEQELSQRPQYSNLGVVDSTGKLMVSASSFSRTNFSNFPFFRRTMATASFSAGRFSPRFHGRKGSIDLGYPIHGSEGVKGVVFASLNLEWIDRFDSKIRGLLSHKQSVWLEVDQAGRIVWRYPGPESFVGRTLSEKHLIKSGQESPAGLMMWTDKNGNDMVSAFAKRESDLTGDAVTGILTVPKEILFADANRALRNNLLWLAGATLLTLVVGYAGSHFLVVRPIKGLARASARLAAGDMRARTGLKHGRDELGQLTLAFDQMAEALEHREQERLRSAKKLQVLSHKLVEVQENERRHIARELHDEIGQALTAAEMNLQAALQSPRAPNIERRLTASMQAVEQVLEQVHDLSLNLRPSMLDDLGLEPALRWLVRKQGELAGVDVDIRCDHFERRIHPVLETECFRIAQEALTNIVRHAKAEKAEVSLTREDHHVHLRVKDDGQGFDVGQLRGDAVRGASLGLLSMEERAALAGGGLTIESGVGRGTEVHAWFPLRWEDEQLSDDPGDPRELKVI